MVNLGLLAAETVSLVWGTRANLTGFASWLHCSDVAHRRSTKLCTMYGRLLGCYIIYTFSVALAPWRIFATCKIHFTSKSCVVVYWQRYCTALQQRASAKLCSWYKEWNYRTFAEVRAPPIFGWAAITLGIGPLSSSLYFTQVGWVTCVE